MPVGEEYYEVESGLDHVFDLCTADESCADMHQSVQPYQRGCFPEHSKPQYARGCFFFSRTRCSSSGSMISTVSLVPSSNRSYWVIPPSTVPSRRVWSTRPLPLVPFGRGYCMPA